jgi:antibiotic biosynthesis monooxygenase (ABM) superfamily enzyme
MWAQIIKTHLKPGMDSEYLALMDQFKAIEQPNSGLVRSFAMRDAKDPETVYMMVMFDSEEKARLRENDPRRTEGLKAASQTMAQIFDGEPQFVDLDVLVENAF